MDGESLLEFNGPEDVLQPLLSASNSSSLKEAFEILIKASRTDVDRAELSLRNILPNVLKLVEFLHHTSNCEYLIQSLKLLRNLCAGEVANQNAFLEQNGIEVLLTVFRYAAVLSNPDIGVIRLGLQVLANVSLAGEKHQQAIWLKFFPDEFCMLARVRSMETCDPLCMILYTCCDGRPGLAAELCRNSGLPIVADIIQTVASEQAFLLRIISEILNERIEEIRVTSEFAMFVLGIFKRSVGAVDFVTRVKSGLPTGSTSVDVMGYSLIILRDICAREGVGDLKKDSLDVVDMLLSSELVDILLSLLRDLESPAMIRKTIKEGEIRGLNLCSSKLCPYKGFRKDLVAVLGNCAYRRKHLQDEIRQKNGILLLLQQCVTDDDNPYLREWGIWSLRNLLEGNAVNQQAVADLEPQGSVDMPELTRLGLRVEIDQNTRRAKLVNIPGSYPKPDE